MGELKTIFEETREYSINELTHETSESILNTKFYSLQNVTEVSHKLKKPIIYFTKNGTVNSSALTANKHKTAILNFANGCVPGGAPEYSNAQEENICRCTNLYECLVTPNISNYFYSNNNENYNHGLGTSSLLYSPNVCVFRDDNNYRFLKNKRFVDVITCAAPCCSIYDEQEAYNIYYERIRLIVLSAIDNKCDSIILGAWGCGVFGQDPRIMSKAFADVLNEYGGYFKHIIFAIKCNEKPSPLYAVFLSIIKATYKGKVKQL